MEHSKKLMGDLKTALEKEHGREFAEHEVEKAADFLKTIAKLQVDIILEDQERQERLKTSPGGFHLEKEGYSCRICHGPASGANSWFDEHGLKCMFCQTAINQKIIPPSVATDSDSWYTGCELEEKFALTARVRRKWIKNGLLISRNIARSDKHTGLELFLISDNSALLPPKKLVQGHMTREVIDGQEWHCLRPWYLFVDLREHLKGYKILDYLKFVPEDPV
jgi:hypothetical protein